MPVAPFELPFPTDRVLEGLAREVITNASADHYLSDRHQAFGSALNERLRLARELHDGLLQALTGATLQLEAALRLVATDRRAARDQILEAQELIVEQQRELRAWIDGVRHPNAPQAPLHADLPTVLQTLCRRVTRWGPRVELDAPDLGRIPASMADDVYRLVEESLNNVKRHARASVARVEVRVAGNAIRLVIADDGCGFPFRGRFDLATLNARGIGPASLKERVQSLAGALVLTSTLSGARVEILLSSNAHARASIFDSMQLAAQRCNHDDPHRNRG